MYGLESRTPRYSLTALTHLKRRKTTFIAGYTQRSDLSKMKLTVQERRNSCQIMSTIKCNNIEAKDEQDDFVVNILYFFRFVI